MKFYIDENLTPELGGPLTRIYRGHQFRLPREEQLGGVEDIALFGDLAMRDFDAIITEDKAQLEDDNERDALRDSCLHWIGVAKLDGSGISQIASQLAVVLGGVALGTRRLAATADHLPFGLPSIHPALATQNRAHLGRSRRKSGTSCSGLTEFSLCF